MITKVEAHLADRSDSECLTQVRTNTIANLHEQEESVEEIACDRGYE